MNYSTTYIAAIVNILVFVLPHFGIHIVDVNAFTAAVAAVAGVVASLWVFIGRYRAGGITILGLRKG